MGCGRRLAAPAKSQAEQRTENGTLLRLNDLSERHLGKVTMQVLSFCQYIFNMYLKNSVANTMMPPPHLLLHPTPSHVHVHNIVIVTLQAELEYIKRYTVLTLLLSLSVYLEHNVTEL